MSNNTTDDIKWRATDIRLQFANYNIEQLALNLAKAFAERDGLTARVAELEKELAQAKAAMDLPAPEPTAAPAMPASPN